MASAIQAMVEAHPRCTLPGHMAGLSAQYRAATFLGGSFYFISVLPPAWQAITLFNPVVDLISGFRCTFFEIADVSVGVSLAMMALFPFVCLAVVWWIFKTRYRLKS